MDRKCASNYMGIWAVDHETLRRLFASWQAGQLRAVTPADSSADALDDIYSVRDGTAFIAADGLLMKSASKFGGTSTTALRRAFRAARADAAVHRIVFDIDSPGGIVAGTDDLATDIYDTDRVKPVYAIVSDLAASAAYWLASQARFVSATRSSRVGSIGVYTVLYDTSGAMEAQGIKARLVSSGGVKGAVADGIPLTDDAVQNIQEEVDQLADLFVGSVATGRRLPKGEIRAMATGDMWFAAAALERKLIDAVESRDDAVRRAMRDGGTPQRDAAGRRLRLS